MEIRLGTVEDAEKLAESAKKVWQEVYEPIIGHKQVAYMLKKFQSPEAFARQITKEGYLYWVVAEGAEIYGYLGYEEEADFYFLSKLYLLPEIRKQGWASQLLAKIPQDKKIRLTVNKYNTIAQARYQKWGFKEVAAIETDIGSGFIMDDYVLEKMPEN